MEADQQEQRGHITAEIGTTGYLQQLPYPEQLQEIVGRLKQCRQAG